MDNFLENNFHKYLMPGKKGPSAGSKASINVVANGVFAPVGPFPAPPVSKLLIIYPTS